MLFYYNRGGKFQKESSMEYKTEKGAVDRLEKEGVGAVFDETGKLILSLASENEVPEGALETNPDGSVPAFDEEGNPVGTVDAATAAQVTGEAGQTSEDHSEPEQGEERAIFNIHTTCDKLNVRALPDPNSKIIGVIAEKEPDKKAHPICKVVNGWGKLTELPEGWVQLAFARVVS